MRHSRLEGQFPVCAPKMPKIWPKWVEGQKLGEKLYMRGPQEGGRSRGIVDHPVDSRQTFWHCHKSLRRQDHAKYNKEIASCGKNNGEILPVPIE